MSRRIVTGPKAGLATSTADPEAEGAQGRLIKYIPSEIVGLYLAALGIVKASAKGTLPSTRTEWIVFWVCLVITPIYLVIATRDPNKGPLFLQVGLATIAFPIWAAAIGGPFARLSWNVDNPEIVPLVLLFVTFGFGQIKPSAGS